MTSTDYFIISQPRTPSYKFHRLPNDQPYIMYMKYLCPGIYFMKYFSKLCTNNLIAATLISFLFGIQGSAQDSINFKNSYELFTDNDAFAIKNFDRHYSYGLGMRVAFRPEQFLGLHHLFPDKKNFFIDIQLKIEGYTPTKKVISQRDVEQDSIFFDRPFAGVLFGQVGANYTFDRSFIKAELLMGVMGPSALSEELQDWIHENITGDGTFDGWDYQVPDQLIFNLNLSGAYDFTPALSGFDVFAMGQARVGNLYIDARPLLGIRIGKFGPITTSSGFGNGVLATKRISEFYLKSTVSAAFNLFNGTAQGNLFNRGFEYAVEDFNQFHTAMTHGIFFRKSHYSIGFDQVFTFGKVLKGEQHIYGRVLFEYSF